MNLTSPFNFNLAAMQLIYTATGVRFAEKITKGDGLLANLPGPQELANTLPLGVKAGYQVVLTNGNNFILGEGCQVYTLKGWVELKSLTDKDHVLQKIVLNPPSSLGGQVIHYQQVLRTDAMPIMVPKKMNLSLAKWLGMFYAEGESSVHDGRVSFRTRDNLVAEEYSRLTSSIFKISPLVLQDKRPNRQPEYYFISQNIVKFLTQNVGSKQFKKIPQFLLEGSNQEHLAFIEGLTVGSKMSKGKPIVYQGSSKLIADFVSLVLRHNGYIVSQYKEDFSSNNQRLDRYGVILMGQHSKASSLTWPPEITEFLTKPLSVLVDVSGKIENLKIPSFHEHYRVYRRLLKSAVKTCPWYIAESLGVDLSKEMYYFVPVSTIKPLTQIKQVSLKVLYPEGLLVNNTVVAGQY